jgi:hypothetical protein
VAFRQLPLIQSQPHGFRAPQTATEQQSDHCCIVSRQNSIQTLGTIDAAAPFVWTGFSGFEWKDCSVVVVAVGM